MTNVLGYAARGVGQRLEPIHYASPGLGEHDVRVSITHCGVCYTDIQGIEDHYGISTFPFVPGHEIVGSVSAVGSAVNELKEGDRVGIGWQGRSCMQCEWCLTRPIYQTRPYSPTAYSPLSQTKDPRRYGRESIE
jgi:uncharacterized zinc-type alcohol dehydrogenase-like protein